MPGNPNQVGIKKMWIIQAGFLPIYAALFVYLKVIGGRTLKYKMLVPLVITLSMQVVYVIVISLIEFKI